MSHPEQELVGTAGGGWVEHTGAAHEIKGINLYVTLHTIHIGRGRPLQAGPMHCIHVQQLPACIISDFLQSSLISAKLFPARSCCCHPPLFSYPVFESEHTPTSWGISLGRCIAWVKILGVCALFRAVGKSREAVLLKNAYTAFSVYNAPRYDRSILSAVDNAIALGVRLDTRAVGTVVPSILL